MSTAVLDQVSPNKLELAPAQSKEPLSIKKETIEVPGVESNRNDDSNPQQGTGKNLGTPKPDESTVPQPAARVSAQRPSLLIPPTAKDDRKLFVGGLPADSKYNPLEKDPLRPRIVIVTTVSLTVMHV